MKVLLKILLINLLFFILLSCRINEKTEIQTIQVKPDKDTYLLLSSISDEIEAIELEITEQSLIKRVKQVFFGSEHIVIYDQNAIMLFDKTGKFLRRIGNVGQGPEEYTGIQDITVDFKNKRVFVFSHGNRLICYDFDGVFMKGVTFDSNCIGY